jgi:hypothetical protein
MEAVGNAVAMEVFGLMLSVGQGSADSVALVFPRQTSSNKKCDRCSPHKYGEMKYN